MKSVIKKPSAWVPLLLSALVLTMLLVMLAHAGVVRQKDEGAEAHLFQIWLVLEICLIPFFAFKWLPRVPYDALLIVVLQISFVLITAFPVFYFHL